MPAPVTLRPGTYCLSASLLQAVYLQPMGHWSTEYERAFQKFRDHFAVLNADATAVLARRRQVGEQAMRREAQQYQELRLARLASHLRAREPDWHVGYSILVYEVSGQELAEALDDR